MFLKLNNVFPPCRSTNHKNLLLRLTVSCKHPGSQGPLMDSAWWKKMLRKVALPIVLNKKNTKSQPVQVNEN